jgi:hypothetical protein
VLDLALARLTDVNGIGNSKPGIYEIAGALVRFGWGDMGVRTSVFGLIDRTNDPTRRAQLLIELVSVGPDDAGIMSRIVDHLKQEVVPVGPAICERWLACSSGPAETIRTMLKISGVKFNLNRKISPSIAGAVRYAFVTAMDAVFSALPELSAEDQEEVAHILRTGLQWPGMRHGAWRLLDKVSVWPEALAGIFFRALIESDLGTWTFRGHLLSWLDRREELDPRHVKEVVRGLAYTSRRDALIQNDLSPKIRNQVEKYRSRRSGHIRRLESRRVGRE